MSASDRIKLRREELGMTQEELAFKLGYKNRSSVNKVENSRDLSLKKVKEFAKALDCEPAYLMGWDDDVPEHIAPNTPELLDLYNRATPEQQDAVINLLRSFVSDKK